MSQEGEPSMEILAMSHNAPIHEPLMTINADVLSSRLQTNSITVGKYLNCIASEDMKISGSGEYSPRLPLDVVGDKRRSWQTRADTHIRDELGHRYIHGEETPTGAGNDGTNVHARTPGEGAMDITTSTSTTNHTTEAETSNMEIQTDMGGTSEVETRGNSPRIGKPRGGSQGVGVAQIRKSLHTEPVLAEAMEQVKVGVGGMSLVDQAANNLSAILLHVNQPPSSPPKAPLSQSTSSNEIINTSSRSSKRISIRNTKELKRSVVVVEEEAEVEGQLSGLELQELASVVEAYPDIEPYEPPDAVGEQSVMMVVGESEEVKGDGVGVGVGIAEPKGDRMVRKEIVRISVVAIVALLVVLLFVLT